jgi:hypothetical protein
MEPLPPPRQASRPPEPRPHGAKDDGGTPIRYVAWLRPLRLLEEDGGDILCFQILGRTPAEYVEAAKVAPFEGDGAWFEIEGLAQMTWNVLGRVETSEVCRGRPQP